MISTKKMAFSGLMIAFSTILLFLESIVPTGRIGFYVLLAFINIVLFIEAGIKYAFLTYIGTFFLAFFMLPDKIGILFYICFFGIYGIIKMLVEKINKRWIEYIIKIVFFNLSFAFMYLFFKQLLFRELVLPISLYIVVIALQPVFILFDFICTFFIRYYFSRFKGRLKL